MHPVVMVVVLYPCFCSVNLFAFHVDAQMSCLLLSEFTFIHVCHRLQYIVG